MANLVTGAVTTTGTVGAINPRTDFLPPWVTGLLQSASGTAITVGLIICVIGFVIAGLILVITRSQGVYGQGAEAKMWALKAVVATVIIAGATSFVTFFIGKTP